MGRRYAILFAGFVTAVPCGAAAGERTLTYRDEATGRARHLVLGCSGDELQLSDAATGTVVAAAAVGTVDRLVVSGRDGAYDDTLTIDLDESLALSGGIDYDGGAGGWDTLALTGGAVREERLTQLSPSSGVFDLDGLVVRFTNLEPINDVAPAATLTVAGTAGDDSVSVTDGPLLTGPSGVLPTTTISSPTFESVTFHSKTIVVFDGLGGNDSVVLANPTPAAGLADFRLVNVEGVSQSSPVSYPELAIRAVGAVTLPLANDVDRIEIETSDGSIVFHDVDGVNVGGVDGFGEPGSTHAGMATSGSGDITLTAGGTIGLADEDVVVAAVVRAAGNASVATNGASSDVICSRFHAAVSGGGAASVSSARSIVLSNDFDNPKPCHVTATGPVTLAAAGTILVSGDSRVTSSTATTLSAPFIHLADASRVQALGTGGADVAIATADLRLDGFSSQAVSSTSGDVHVTTDRFFTISGSPWRIQAPAGTVRFGTASAARPVDLGSTGDAAAALEISDGERDRLLAPQVVIASQSALFSVTSTIDGAFDGSDPVLVLESGGGFTGAGSRALLVPTLTLVDTSATPRIWTLHQDFVTVSPGAAIPLAGLSTLAAGGGSGADQFYVTPSGSLVFTVDGNAPLPPADPGDALVVDTSGTSGASYDAVGTPSGLQGQYTFASHQPVHFREIEPDSGFRTLTPCRLLDTRQPGQGPALAHATVRQLLVHGVCGLPTTALALALNVTVAGASGFGHLQVFPGDLAAPATSTVNFSAGQTRANNAVVPLATDGSGTIALRAVLAGGGSVHAIVDITGYFE